MHTKTLGLLALAALATSACSQEKSTTTTTPETTTTTTTTTTAVDTLAYRSTADMMADRVAQDLKLADSAVVRRIRTTYYTRGRQLSGFATDTTGRYAATRTANDNANREIKTILANPVQYNTYAGNLGTYYPGQPYTTVTVEKGTGATAKPSSTQSVGQGSGVKKMEKEDDGDRKTKFENGAKIKRDADGSVKIKRADGTKIKIDEDGNRTVKKGLFK